MDGLSSPLESRLNVKAGDVVVAGKGCPPSTSVMRALEKALTGELRVAPRNTALTVEEFLTDQ
jgi:hypothetical protein